MRRGILVVIGGAFERLFCPEGREFEQANLQKFNARAVARGGGGLNFRIDRRIRLLLKKKNPAQRVYFFSFILINFLVLFFFIHWRLLIALGSVQIRRAQTKDLNEANQAVCSMSSSL